MTSTQLAAGTVQITRRYPAAASRVFRALTDPEEFKRWWTPPGYELVGLDLDVRPGGAYKIEMRKLPDGAPFHVSGVYHEVVSGSRLVFTWAWSHLHDMPPDSTLVTIKLKEENGETHLVLTHEGLKDEKMCIDHQKGWTACCDRIESQL
jgi:uncharacterized protein YndB with AHSA1/START domain